MVVSAALVAVIENVPATLPAVYKPLDEMEPPVADQVTALFELPVTVALNCCVPPVCTVAELGEIETDTVAGGGGVAVTVIAACALFVLSAELVAVTVKFPAPEPAVYRPLEEIVPPVAVQPTFEFVLPVTVAENCCVAPACTEAV